MNGKIVGSKPLCVALAQCKEDKGQGPGMFPVYSYVNSIERVKINIIWPWKRTNNAKGWDTARKKQRGYLPSRPKICWTVQGVYASTGEEIVHKSRW